jgi:NO-binding membrane sensor protein with MHYT domain
VVVHNFSYGLLNPGFAYLISCLGCFLGLQCTARARALEGGQRTRWLLLGAVSIGATGIWVMHFIAVLGFTIPGQTITYNVPVTILSMLIAVGVVGVGLLIVGFGGQGPGPLLLGGAIIGIGIASMHYMGMWAMRMPDTMSYNARLVALSVAIAIVAGTRRAMGRTAPHRHAAHHHRVPDHGGGRERDASHGHGGHACPGGTRRRHGGDGWRCHRHRLPGAAHPGNHRPDLRGDGDRHPGADGGGDPRACGLDGAHRQTLSKCPAAVAVTRWPRAARRRAVGTHGPPS